MKNFDIIVIGGGHAGIEASCIAAKMGASALLVTGNVDFIGQMSCNPAIGGVAKGNIVREIDALGGVMGKLIDRAGIHFRMLNASKGSAVWGPRAQADRIHYRRAAREAVESCANVALLQAAVVKIDTASSNGLSVILAHGEKITARAIVIAAGTFLNGTIHIGLNTHSGGRFGEPAACGLTESVRELGVKSGRLKTGTPPRIDGRTVDYSALAVQHGDADPWPFSFFTRGKLANKTVCYAAKTTSETHKHVLDNINRSSFNAGIAPSDYPRYCPSIEDKIMRFGERDGHVLYLEPESLENNELYINGLSTSLPADAQEKVIASIAGLENARILRFGYGIEYDYFQPLQLKPTLESKIVPGLFFAGQINGTSGYEEAACQGLVAGINAVAAARGEEPVILGRDSSYIGVLIDDLVTKGTDEPYRMFTSRAEYRLLLRQDDCDERLMPIAHKLGTISDAQFDERRRFWDKKQKCAEWLGKLRISPAQYDKISGGAGKPLSQTEIAADLLKRPEVTLDALLNEVTASGGADVGTEMWTTCEQGAGRTFDRHLLLGVESAIKYDGFVRKMIKDIEKLRKLEETVIPDDFSYDGVPGLLTESRQKLSKIRPGTLGQASRVGGVTPADISILAMCLLKKNV